MARNSQLLAGVAALGFFLAAAAPCRGDGTTDFLLRLLGLKPKNAEVASTPTDAVPAVVDMPAGVARPARVADLDATHKQTALLRVIDDKSQDTQLHTFCLDLQGRILAGCGQSSQGEVRVFDPDGKYLSTWKLPVVPEAINIDPKGIIYVAGEGQLLKLDPQGQVILKKQAPHIEAMSGNKDQMRKLVISQHESRAQIYKQSLQVYDRQIDLLNKKKESAGELTASEKQRLAIYQRSKESMEEYVKDLGSDDAGLSDEQVAKQVKLMLSSKSKASSISSTGEEVFLACSAIQGYGYQVYRMDSEFENAKSIVDGLRGCCGQMDVQVSDNGVFVAENSRHRVACFDREGKLLTSWGQRDRTGEKGFSSCCNPMNVCFGPQGAVFTAESTTGHIKQFTPNGKFVSHVGVVKLVPGCKKVSIAVSPDGKRVYMLDITRRHIVLMTQQPSRPETSEADAATAEGDTGG